MSKISVIIPTCNEEAFVKNAIQSVEFADEIIVIDSNSTDRTAQIAEGLGCKVLFREFDNFSNQKNHALQFASNEWVLFLDADERITNRLRYEILEAVKSNEFTGYKLYFPHFFMNRFLYHHSNMVTRLVKKDSCHFSGDVHEKLHVNGKMGKLKHQVNHYTYKGLTHYISKKDHYSYFQSQQALKKNKNASLLVFFFKPFYRFFSSYVLRGGFKDGIPGLIVARINAYGVFSRYAKLEISKHHQNQNRP